MERFLNGCAKCVLVLWLSIFAGLLLAVLSGTLMYFLGWGPVAFRQVCAIVAAVLCSVALIAAGVWAASRLGC